MTDRILFRLTAAGIPIQEGIVGRLNYTFLPALAALCVGGCASTGPTPDPFPDDVDATLAAGFDNITTLHSNAAVITSGTGSWQMDEGGGAATITVDGSSYVLVANAASDVVTEPGWSKPVNYTRYPLSSGTEDGAFLLGEHLFIGAMVDAGGDYYLTQGGNETPSDGLPNMTVNYEGAWLVSEIAALSEAGIYEASANFDDGTMTFAIEDDFGTSLGAGAGTISGSTFSSSFNLTGGGVVSTNNVNGNFYGPNADEMAGLIQGTGGTGQTFGYLFGHQQ
ncbi:transferrin-binding protein-like solute binding protein [Pelagibacterium xiamenense]|uniref:transferrin-binding protein-like solute binding protein n=1 Tax=Pelagibacterium xiamenense TaxID=2901140 RepID=UPI001E3CDF71|nr:transferrin-binding protein-like solute binding protein [Pelagibacterium xiamenense]MCD7059784.1 transferrin-binding protein-like solute binding protein [Pelagibacterium xiamenense]